MEKKKVEKKEVTIIILDKYKIIQTAYSYNLYLWKKDDFSKSAEGYYSTLEFALNRILLLEMGKRHNQKTLGINDYLDKLREIYKEIKKYVNPVV